LNPEQYEAWYHTDRGRWSADRESQLLLNLLQPVAGAAVLDVGCGTGHFSRRFAAQGLRVTGIDLDSAALVYAREQNSGVSYVQGTATALPFPDSSFEYCTAVTSLCFIDDPVAAIKEMGRVSRDGFALGLLNRRSLLYGQKHGRGAYRGARWDDVETVKRWLACAELGAEVAWRMAIFVPGGGWLARLLEKLLPAWLPVGSFLAVSARPKAGK